MNNLERIGLTRWVARACFAAAIIMPVHGYGQTPAAQTPQAEPATEKSGAGWTTKSAPETTSPQNKALDFQTPIVLTADQIELIENINIYLNGLIDLQGRFVQTDHRNEETRGRFYVKRPGRLRFDYSAPSKLRVVSDGEYLSVEDHDLKTVDKYPLNATPIQLLLGEDVNLTRDSVILDMRHDDTAVAIVIKDKSGNSSGHLQLFFKLPELELYEWVITDDQGLDTRIQLADLVAGDAKSVEFFKATSLVLEDLDNN